MNTERKKSQSKRLCSTALHESVLAWQTFILLVCLFFFVAALTSCAGTPSFSPHYLDTQLKEMREYEVVDPKNFSIKYKDRHPMTWGSGRSYGNGFFCIPAGEAAAWRQHLLRERNRCEQKDGQ